jgi:hypothetical protein
VKVAGSSPAVACFFLGNCPADNHQLVAEDLVEDGTLSHISNAYSLRQGRAKPPTSVVEAFQFFVVEAFQFFSIKILFHFYTF